MARKSTKATQAEPTLTTTHKFHGPQRRIIRKGVEELQKLYRDAKNTARKAFLPEDDAIAGLEMCKTTLEVIPAGISDDHDGSFQITDEVRMCIASGLLVRGAALVKKREALALDEVDPREVQNKIDEVEALRASLSDQRNLFEYVGKDQDDPEHVQGLLVQVLPESQRLTVEEVAEWPFTWRKQAQRWAEKCIEAQENPDDAKINIPPRPDFLPSAKQLSVV